MAYASRLGGIGCDDALADLAVEPRLVKISHQEHGVDAARRPGNRVCVGKVAGDDFGPCCREPPRRVAVRLSGERPDAVSPVDERVGYRAALLAGVEVPCIASSTGIEPQAVGALPRHLAALMQTNINVQGLTVEAALTGRRDAIYHAAMLDPHTAAELSLEERPRSLVDDLLDAHGHWIPPAGYERSGPVTRTGTA